MCQESIWQYNPVGNKSWLKILKKCLFRRRFSQKLENLKHWIFTEVKIWPRVCYLQKIQIWHKHIFQVTAPQKAIFFRPSKYKLSKPLLRSNFTSKFEASLIDRAKMASFSISSHISPKSIFFRLYFINSLLLTIYFSKYV